MTRFGTFGNCTCKRVLDLLEPGDLRLGEVVIRRLAVVELGVNNGSGDGGWLQTVITASAGHVVTMHGAGHLPVSHSTPAVVCTAVGLQTAGLYYSHVS